MKKLINIIKNNGVDKNYTDELNQYIETVNIFGLVFIFFTIPFIFIFHKSFSAQIIITIPIFFQIISFILLKLKFHKIGRIIFSINTSTSVYLIAALVYINNGTDGMAAKFLILGSAILPFITFKKEEWKYLVIVLLLILTYLLTFNYINNILNLKSIHKNLDSSALRILSVITAFFMFTVVLYYYKKIITEQNQRLKGLNTNLKQKNEELEAISEELHQNNEELLTAKEEILKSEEKYNLVANNMTDLIWMLDLDLHPKYISPSCSEFFGYSEADIRTISLKEIHPKKSIYTLLEFRYEITKTKNINSKKHFEVEYIHKDGHIFPAEVYGFVVSDSQGKPIGIGGVSRDITEQKKIQTELKKSKQKIEISHDNTLADIRYAQTIQKSLLTSKNIIDKYFENYFIIYNPKDLVSGDFYYVVKKNKYIIFAVADCTGHGVAGGFISMLGISYLHEIVSIQEVNNAGTVLERLREKVKSTFVTFGSENPNGMDIAFCTIDTKTNILQYSGAYNPLFIIRENKIIEYKATRNPIGFNPVEKEFENHEIQLQNNDLIYLFSDGFQDQIGGEKGKKYLSKNFKKLIVQNSHLPMDEQKTNLERTIKEWKGDLEQVDDITIMGVKWHI